MPLFDRKFRKELFSKNFDIVHIHSPFFVSRLGVKYAKTHKIPLVATLHSQYKKDFLTATKSKILSNLLLKNAMKPFNKCTECWAVNNGIKRLFTEEYKLTAPCNVQSNATDMLTVEKNTAYQFIKENYGIEEDKNVLLFSGRINSLKNVFFIVESLKKVYDAGIDFTMLFLGSGPDEKKLEEKIKELGLENNVRLLGRINDRKSLAMFYRRAQLFLFPSKYDASSLVQIEAASQYTPTVFLEGTITSETAIDGVSGIITKDCTEDFADKIIYALKNPDYLNKLSNGAYEHMYLTWDEVVKSAYDRYCSLIEQNQK